MGSASLALGLVCVGGGLAFRGSSARPLALGVTWALKLLALPLLAVGISRLLGANDRVTRGPLPRGPAGRLQRLRHGPADARRCAVEGLTGHAAIAAGRRDDSARTAAPGLGGGVDGLTFR